MGTKYIVEPIEIERPRSWGDMDPATKEMSSYKGKTPGACKPEDSIVIEGDTYKNVRTIPAGQSPFKNIF